MFLIKCNKIGTFYEFDMLLASETRIDMVKIKSLSGGIKRK